MNLFQGIGVSPGIIVGKVYLYVKEGYGGVRREIAPDQVDHEIKRFQAAIQKAKIQLKKFQQKVKTELGQTHASIFESHGMILEDPVVIEATEQKIRKERVNSEYAVSEILKNFVAQMEQIDDPFLKTRVSDFNDVGRRVLMNLSGVEKNPLTHLEETVIIVSYDLAPSDTASMDKTRVLGFVTEVGSKTSHTAIMAKALEIPAVVAATGVSKAVSTGDTIVIDGGHGTVIVNPDKTTLKEYWAAQKRITISDLEKEKFKKLPSETADGIPIKVSANIELPEEVEHVKHHGARGIGLLRTEFFYLHSAELPTEEELFKTYKSVLKSIMPDEVVIRTLDIGGDKFSSSLNMSPELNPFLGCRAIRFCLQRPDIFKTQLRAILRASTFGNLRIMYPMISGVGELRAANKILDSVKKDLRKEGIPFKEDIPVGVMIEIPSAAVTADILSKEADFFSIGTNDLIQYTLAVDRVNEQVANLYDPFHPSVLRLIQRTVDEAHKVGIKVSMCGEMAGDPLMTRVLLGLGLTEFSMAPALIPEVKKTIRSTHLEEAKKQVADIMQFSTGDEIRNYLQKFEK